ncbi:MAG: response regulator [Acidobacteria bacterium]|nr:response regulator [Acidobacteriota bacterium]
MEPILIVDDAPTNRKLTQRVLAGAGYDVRAVSDGGAALHAIAEFRPRVVITDLRLNGMDGLALTRRIKEEPASRDIAVIVVTGCDTEEDRRAAAHAGCDEFIVKPIDTRALPGIVQAQLQRRREIAVAAEPLPSAAELPAWAAPLRREFLNEGGSRCAALLAEGPGAAEIRAAAHVWAGLGGTFGYPEISTLARRVHDRLGRPDSAPDHEITGWLQGLLALFEQASGRANENPVSPELAALLHGRRIALIGFDSATSARLTAALAGAGAVMAGAAGDEPPACDLVIANAAARAAVRPRREPRRRLLLLGTPPGGPGPDALLAAPHVDFVAEPWSAAEVLSRAGRLLAGRYDPGVPPAEPSGGPARIVIADDDPTILALLKATVENSGMECAVAREGDAALHLVRSTGAHAAILDVMMPNMDGLEVLASIRNDPALEHVRVLMLSALQQETDIVRAFGLGADDYVTKPFSPVEVIARVKRLRRAVS